MSQLTNARIPSMRRLLQADKVRNFLDICAKDISQLKTVDAQYNSYPTAEFTKYRFNPLNRFPLVHLRSTQNDRFFVIPNSICYVRGVYSGLYWWFHDYYENVTGNAKRFRDYFGKPFEKYVGLQLKSIYGKHAVIPEIEYDRGGRKFVDWIVVKKNKAYLFEVKAYQLTLPVRLRAEQDDLESFVTQKIVESIIKVFLKIKYDIPKFNELTAYRKMKLIPIIVFYDLPLVSTNLYSSIIKKSLLIREAAEKKLSGLSAFECHLLNIDEFEQYAGVSDLVEIEDVFYDLKRNPNDGFIPNLTRRSPRAGTNKLLDDMYEKLWRETTGWGYFFVKLRRVADELFQKLKPSSSQT